ncbi:hypothetical protein [Kluyvera georgiana]|uniref:hypothetical protein n=1 Tax=Kluyvera georgiana TaxID=73098 RepID=UPI0015DD2377|nr:hypothetical protein WP7S18C02_05450 [Klebsiella sp. WP7-S18-CRE-02]BBS94952.1 hypothetical protein WP7S18C03_05450 [Klebsiella sp. WP7-S18-CRE-03]BBS99983.1 hypothetical protein WP7S18E04_05460 [Klebsiella sp. WP7-S18-ESBL-04]HAT3952767.1 hypothetical protein [Kluyvera ascorbata]
MLSSNPGWEKGILSWTLLYMLKESILFVIIFFYKERESAIRAYATFCSEHANVKDVDKAQWFVMGKLREMGWELEQDITGGRLIKIR